MDNIFILKRIAETDDGTFGVLLDRNVPFAVTLENRWYDNKTNLSCIPTGTYYCSRVNSPRFGHTWEIQEVPNRTHILFHWGNRDNDTNGCVLVAEEFGTLYGENAILSSNSKHRGFQELIDKTKDINDFQLIIQEFI